MAKNVHLFLPTGVLKKTKLYSPQQCFESLQTIPRTVRKNVVLFLMDLRISPDIGNGLKNLLNWRRPESSEGSPVGFALLLIDSFDY